MKKYPNNKTLLWMVLHDRILSTQEMLIKLFKGQDAVNKILKKTRKNDLQIAYKYSLEHNKEYLEKNLENWLNMPPKFPSNRNFKFRGEKQEEIDHWGIPPYISKVLEEHQAGPIILNEEQEPTGKNIWKKYFFEKIFGKKPYLKPKVNLASDLKEDKKKFKVDVVNINKKGYRTLWGRFQYFFLYGYPTWQYTKTAWNTYEKFLNQTEKLYEQYIAFTFKNWYSYNYLANIWSQATYARVLRHWRRDEDGYQKKMMLATIWHKHIRMNLEPKLLKYTIEKQKKAPLLKKKFNIVLDKKKKFWWSKENINIRKFGYGLGVRKLDLNIQRDTLIPLQTRPRVGNDYLNTDWLSDTWFTQQEDFSRFIIPWLNHIKIMDSPTTNQHLVKAINLKKIEDIDKTKEQREANKGEEEEYQHVLTYPLKKGEGLPRNVFKINTPLPFFKRYERLLDFQHVIQRALKKRPIYLSDLYYCLAPFTTVTLNRVQKKIRLLYKLDDKFPFFLAGKQPTAVEMNLIHNPLIKHDQHIIG